jgi:hypothetical protein
MFGGGFGGFNFGGFGGHGHDDHEVGKIYIQIFRTYLYTK